MPVAEPTMRMSFDDFARDVEGVFDLVVRENKPVFIETKQGEVVVLEPAAVQQMSKAEYQPKKNTEDERSMFLASAGGWKGLVDTDKLVQDIYKSRRSED